MDTRSRLLRAGAALFADQGFQETTIQQLATHAGANIAAVNYHFGGKAQLFVEVVMKAMEAASGPMPCLADDPGDPEGRLEAFITWHIQQVAAAHTKPLFLQLTPQQMVGPESALDAMVERIVRPRHVALKEIVRALLPDDTPDDVVHACVRSIVGQSLFYKLAQPVLDRLEPDFTLDEATARDIAKHIATFSLAGIRAIAASPAHAGTERGA
ncbi:MAG: CerR family C-terminal domain-containing protein [Planctomycetota bacterium]|nr:CerR family C-terminal domain-containing protein [Planctomycetota bacterium]